MASPIFHFVKEVVAAFVVVVSRFVFELFRLILGDDSFSHQQIQQGIIDAVGLGARHGRNGKERHEDGGQGEQ